MTTSEIHIDSRRFTGWAIDLPGAPLLVVKAEKGFVMCGYLDIATADKVGAAAAVVRGVKTLGDLLAKPVTDVSAAARALGVTPGMMGRDALLRLA
jgi:uncharacterized protein YunC (DUF1805 family)